MLWILNVWESFVCNLNIIKFVFLIATAAEAHGYCSKSLLPYLQPPLIFQNVQKIVQTEGQNLNLKDLIYNYSIQKNLDFDCEEHGRVYFRNQ